MKIDVPTQHLEIHQLLPLQQRRRPSRSLAIHPRRRHRHGMIHKTVGHENTGDPAVRHLVTILVTLKVIRLLEHIGHLMMTPRIDPLRRTDTFQLDVLFLKSTTDIVRATCHTAHGIFVANRMLNRPMTKSMNGAMPILDTMNEGSMQQRQCHLNTTTVHGTRLVHLIVMIRIMLKARKTIADERLSP